MCATPLTRKVAYSIILTHLCPPYLAQILGFWVTCGVKIMSLCHGENDSHLKLIPTSTSDIYTVFENIFMLSTGIQ
jgi:hypothetical protein